MNEKQMRLVDPIGDEIILLIYHNGKWQFGTSVEALNSWLSNRNSEVRDGGESLYIRYT